MSSEHLHHEQAGDHHHDAHHGPRTLPATLVAPPEVLVWRTRALIVAVVFAVISLAFAFSPDGRSHMLRAYLLGVILSFSFAGGGLVLLMMQYVSGGKWGLLLRRPLEAMSRTLWLVLAMFLPLIFFMKKLYLWAAYPTVEATENGVLHHLITEGQAHALNFKRPMLSPTSVVVQTLIVFAILGTFMTLLNKWSLQRDADPEAGTESSFNRWRIKFENLSGIGVLIYVIVMTVLIIDWVMALNITWYSSVWGLKFLVGQGYAVLALGVLTVILLSKFEPMKTILRTTEQHDLGKFLFAFVMLNIYLTFGEFLIMWSGNVPDEIPWYLDRIRGGWWYICTLDFLCHWLIPFCILLSRSTKRNKKRMIWVTCFMLFARCVDLFWIIEPNFKDSAANFHLGGGTLAYLTVPVAVVGLWAAYYLTQLAARPLVNVNDPHTEEILEPEHAH
ncbi:hypothetical protein FTO74_00305 [Granulicella sp. WH15]|uniref:hypothetical protein n=1 Tax=Granulicella sp. WH15 TaxID=2602070 RepID=UPI001367823E|nr:hypothetical protein [Granulicella sp. WH15]QHN01990.1 hypothetical protein FTO74_00305 [Granulicella sp. WH15]